MFVCLCVGEGRGGLGEGTGGLPVLAFDIVIPLNTTCHFILCPTSFGLEKSFSMDLYRDFEELVYKIRVMILSCMRA